MNEVLRKIDCCICLVSLVDDGSGTQRSGGDDVAALPCGHLFHLPCILQHLEHKSACPLCREQVSTTGDRFVKLALNGSNEDAKSPEAYEELLVKQCRALGDRQLTLGSRIKALQASETELKNQRDIHAKALTSMKQQIALLEGNVSSAASLAALRQAAVESRFALEQLNVDIAAAIREGEEIEEKIAKAKRKRARCQ